MARSGPQLRRHKDGGAVAKFNGRVLRFGVFDDDESHRRFTALKTAWLENGRELLPEVLAAGKKESQPAGIAPVPVSQPVSTISETTVPAQGRGRTVDEVCDAYLANLSPRDRLLGQRGTLSQGTPHLGLGRRIPIRDRSGRRGP